MSRIQASAGIVLAAVLFGCGLEDEETKGLETDASDDMGAPQVKSSCALPCDDAADCAAAGGGRPEDWSCEGLGLVGVCEYASSTPPQCDPQMCAAGTVPLCDRHLGQPICVQPCESDDDCVAPSLCGGSLDDGSAYCTANADVGCSLGGCTCFEDTDCPAQPLICAPNGG